MGITQAQVSISVLIEQFECLLFCTISSEQVCELMRLDWTTNVKEEAFSGC